MKETVPGYKNVQEKVLQDFEKVGFLKFQEQKLSLFSYQ